MGKITTTFRSKTAWVLLRGVSDMLGTFSYWVSTQNNKYCKMSSTTNCVNHSYIFEEPPACHEYQEPKLFIIDSPLETLQ